ncbi:uncharacterized protein BDZ99DRAFT_552033 [Mytilinidion resinicola]|uniref:Uncharacterized protein n=1 Tax=Mytilinidion resinicola TaxID=574789 RepID=A0A6A6Y078_9PEZI|nr:uncharacterized protein BDZ99DRAFT_552033 [Mytilinidion resinicola]KAF2802172.1 hypothetical protein BDZ99DRAFT_552033 [Mytilinidion resinicola]
MADTYAPPPGAWNPPDVHPVYQPNASSYENLANPLMDAPPPLSPELDPSKPARHRRRRRHRDEAPEDLSEDPRHQTANSPSRSGPPKPRDRTKSTSPDQPQPQSLIGRLYRTLLSRVDGRSRAASPDRPHDVQPSRPSFSPEQQRRESHRRSHRRDEQVQGSSPDKRRHRKSREERGVSPFSPSHRPSPELHGPKGERAHRRSHQPRHQLSPNAPRRHAKREHRSRSKEPDAEEKRGAHRRSRARGDGEEMGE